MTAKKKKKTRARPIRKRRVIKLGAGDALILFSDNFFWDPDDPTSCPVVATTYPDALPATFAANVRWDLNWDDVNNVVFEPGLVDLVAKKINPFDIVLRGSKAKPFIQAKIKSKGQINVGAYKYAVLYDRNVAQDPELDITGTRSR